MAELKEIEVDKVEYKIDWKFLACIYGLGEANQDYACIWCKCQRNKRYDITRTWSLTDKQHG